MYAQKKSIDNTHIVREKDRQRNRELLAVLSLGVPIGFFLLVFAWQNLEVIRLGRDATQLQKTLKEQETAHKQLQGELDRLTSFDAVEKQVAKLGFEPAAPTAIVMVEPAVGGRSGNAAAPVVVAPTPVVPATAVPAHVGSAPAVPAPVASAPVVPAPAVSSRAERSGVEGSPAKNTARASARDSSTPLRSGRNDTRRATPAELRPSALGPSPLGPRSLTPSSPARSAHGVR